MRATKRKKLLDIYQESNAQHPDSDEEASRNAQRQLHDLQELSIPTTRWQTPSTFPPPR